MSRCDWAIAQPVSLAMVTLDSFADIESSHHKSFAQVTCFALKILNLPHKTVFFYKAQRTNES